MVSLILITVVGIVSWGSVHKHLVGINSPLSALTSKNVTEDMARDLIGARIQTVGAEQAYAEFKIFNSSGNEAREHFLAHAFGEALYEKMGNAGLSICDSSFTFGCYHSFFENTVAKEGIGALPILDSECRGLLRNKALECQHGIGHGIMVYEGTDIVAALKLCKTLQWYPRGGCRNGVFMEYNFSNFTALNGEENVRMLKPSESPYFPCTIVPEEFTASCYSQQPFWWARIFQTDYARMGILCATIINNESSQACFRGVGSSVAIFSKYSASMAAKVCTKMPNKSGEGLCDEGASLLFASKGKPGANSLCLTIPPPGGERCLQELKLFPALPQQIKTDDRGF